MSNFRPLQIEDIPEGSERGSIAHSESTEVAVRPDADTVMAGGTPQYFAQAGPSNILEQFRAIDRQLRSKKAPSTSSDGAILRKIQLGERTIRDQEIRIDEQRAQVAALLRRQQELQQQVNNSEVALAYLAQQAAQAASTAAEGTAQLGQAVATQREADSNNMAALLQTFRTDIQATLAATVQQAARQEAQIAQVHLPANTMNQPTNKLLQLDTQAQDNKIRGWMAGQAGPSGQHRGGSLPPALPRPTPLRPPSPAAPVVPIPPPVLPPAPPAPPAATARAIPKDPKMSAPSPFTGKSSELQNFQFAVREYVQIKVNELPDETARLAFLTTMFSGSLLDWWRVIRTSVTTHEEALRRLEEDFGDPMIHVHAYREITTLHQNNLSISDYINKVERLNLHAGIDQSFLLRIMNDNIKPEIALAIAISPYDYSDYQTWKAAVLRIGAQLEYVKSRQSAHRPQAAQASSHRQRNTERPASGLQPRSHQPPRNFAPAPNTGVILPAVVKDQCVRDGLCIKCGRGKHLALECRTGRALLMTDFLATIPQQKSDPHPRPRPRPRPRPQHRPQHRPQARSGKRKEGPGLEEGLEPSKRQDSGKGKAA